MGFQDQTEMGGTRGAFLTTHWTLIEDVKAGSDKKKELIGLLLKTYWKPVYCYLRRKGYDNEQAKDLTQDFFHEVVLNRQLVGRADQDKGQFRSFLLYALNQYLINYNRDQRAQKRIPPEKLVSFDTSEPPVLPESFLQASPEDSYQYAWLSALLERVVSDVRTSCIEQGMKIHWTLFNERVIKPILEDITPLSVSQLCEDYEIENVKKASNMIVTVKRRFRTALIEHVRNSVALQEQTGEELEFLLQFLPGDAQRLE